MGEGDDVHDSEEVSVCPALGGHLLLGVRVDHLVPQTAQGHQRPLGDEDERGGRGLLQDSVIHWPQSREDPEEGGLATTIRSSYKDVLARPKGE